MSILPVHASLTAVCLLLGTLLSPALAGELWWERGADAWYYKDDWQGLSLKRGQAFTKTCQVPEGAVDGWIVVWGRSGYTLKLNGKAVGQSVDGCIIDDYSLKRFLDNSKQVALTIEGREVCAEGEIVDVTGKRHPFKTDATWRTERGREPVAEPMKAGPSHGAYHRAHNGRPMAYNAEESCKTAIARHMARIQKLKEHDAFVMRRLRPAGDILSFAADAPWRSAAKEAEGLSPSMALREAIAHCKVGRIEEALRFIRSASSWLPVTAKRVIGVTQGYRAARRALGKANEKALRAAGATGTCTPLDEFPEDRFAWLNARELIGNDPARWPFVVAPTACDFIDISGRWLFRTDPHNEGGKNRWHTLPAGKLDPRWKPITVPGEWERQGYTTDNPKSPADCPYDLPDRRCGDKPYNGFAWYLAMPHIPSAWQARKVMLATGTIANWGRVFFNGRPLGEGQSGGPGTVELPSDAIAWGKPNVIAIQVYNHNNFGGITGGPLAIYAEGAKPSVVETPGPLSYVTEATYPTPDGPVHTTFYAGAMSPAVVVATDAPALELWGWQAKGFFAPTTARYVTADGPQEPELAPPPEEPQDGAELAENWIRLRSAKHDALIVLERRPSRLEWGANALGLPTGTIRYDSGPVRAAILVMPEEVRLDDAECRFWARALRRYPVAATEIVKPGKPQTCWIRYNYLDLGGFGSLEPLTVAPVPMLLSYGLKHEHPGLAIQKARMTGYHSAHAPYLVVEGTDTVQYQAPPVDRRKVMKGVGELFGKMKPEHNARGGLSEDVMFQRMGEWGFDHCRYAFAFHARWDLPLVEHMGGPILEDNDAAWQRLDQLVDKCNTAGMQMMLCWFFNEDQPQKDTGDAVRNSTRYWRARPEAQKNAFELWRRIAARYADRPEWAISYDFFNEPAYMNPHHWNQVMKRLTAIIRSVDKKHLIVWESADGWAQPHWCLWMEPVQDDNVVYSFHHYGKHWGYARDEYYPSTKATHERTQIDPWLHAILFGIRHHVPIHCGEFGLSMIQPAGSGERWLEDYLALFERFGIGWNWWNYSGRDIYRTGLAAGNRISPYVPILRTWMQRSGWGASRRTRGQ